MFLQIKNLKKSFGEGDNRIEVLKGIDLSVKKGEICVLLGPSGSGKSTLLNIIGGIDSSDSGDILIEGEPLTVLKEDTMLNHLGLYNSFMVDLSLKLKFYELLDDVELDMDRMVNTLWK